jgi:hypothetical protein
MQADERREGDKTTANKIMGFFPDTLVTRVCFLYALQPILMANADIATQLNVKV